MKYKVVGWTYYEADYPDADCSWAMRTCIVNDVKKHGYLFSGYEHQESYKTVPVLNTGEKVTFSRRGFANVMSDAHGYTGPYDYSSFMEYQSIAPNARKLPLQSPSSKDFVEKSTLVEHFVVEVDQEQWQLLQTKGRICVVDTPYLDYIDKCDTITIKCGNEEYNGVVADVDKGKQISTQDRYKMMSMYSLPEEERKALQERIENTPVTCTIVLAND